MITTIFIALGLAADAFAVSITRGISIKCLKPRQALVIALFFGAFQAGMPVLGWFFGSALIDLIRAFDHWVAFGLLGLIGGKMIYEAVSHKADEQVCVELSLTLLLMLSVATSIDALAVGVTFACLNTPILQPIIIIGVVTFLLSVVGVYLGNLCGNRFEHKIEIIGGIILIAIGSKILLEHLLMS